VQAETTSKTRAKSATRWKRAKKPEEMSQIRESGEKRNCRKKM
jgi:hypothetical protein